MDDGWTSYRSTPPEDTVLARGEQLPDGIALSILVDSGAEALPTLLVARGGMVRAFVNADTVNLTHIVQKLDNFRPIRSPLSGTLERVDAGIRKKIAQIGALVD
jgi:hypothetical protein